MSPEQIDAKEQDSPQRHLFAGSRALRVVYRASARLTHRLWVVIVSCAAAPSPTTPSEIVKDLDPAIERVIDRCLQKDRRDDRLQRCKLPRRFRAAIRLPPRWLPARPLPEMVAAGRRKAPTSGVAVAMFVSFLVGRSS